MTTKKQLQIAAHSKNAALTPEQKRFNRLIERIEQARGQVRAWQEAIPLFRQAYVEHIAPMQKTYANSRRDWVLALDRAYRAGDWSRPDSKTLQQLICGTSIELLGETPDDSELRDLFERHSDTDYDTHQQEDLLGMKGLAELMTGLDLGDDDISSNAELFQRVHEGMSARQDAEIDAEIDAEADAQVGAARSASAAGPRSRADAARQQRQAAEAARVAQSVRDIYRKLVSALHPDREPDPQQQRTKTELMQKVNQAYAANDLLTLLEVQLQIEQIDLDAVRRIDSKQIKRYNRLLAEQLEQIDDEIEHIKISFCFDFGMDPNQRLNPNRLGAMIEAETRSLRACTAEQALDVRRLADRAATRRWLKQQRQWLNAPPPFDNMF